MQKFLTPRTVIIVLILIIISLLFYFYLSVLMPILLAFLTALLLEPLIKGVQKHLRIRQRLVAVTLVFSFFVCVIAAVFYFTITKLVNQAIMFIDRLPYYIVEINLFFEQLIADYNQVVENLPPVMILELQRQSEVILNRGEDLAERIIPLLASWAQAIPNLVIVTIIYLITLFLISLDLPNVTERFFGYFKEKNAQTVRYMFRRLGRVFVGFFKAQFLVSIVIFIVTYIGLLLISPDNALFMAIIIWIIDFIPVIGSIIILAPWALFNLIQGSTALGIQLLVLATVLLALRRTLEPKIMGDQIGLSALSTLISLYLGFYLLGVIGLIAGPLLLIAFKSAKEAGVIKTDFKF